MRDGFLWRTACLQENVEGDEECNSIPESHGAAETPKSGPGRAGREMREHPSWGNRDDYFKEYQQQLQPALSDLLFRGTWVEKVSQAFLHSATKLFLYEISFRFIFCSFKLLSVLSWHQAHLEITCLISAISGTEPSHTLFMLNILQQPETAFSFLHSVHLEEN